MRTDSLRGLLVDQLREIYMAENQQIEVLPRMAQVASNAELKDAINQHVEQTQQHIQRLEDIFGQLQENPNRPDGALSQAIQGLIREADEVIRASGAPDVKDAALIATAQKLEHYEIASYGTVRTFANELDFKSGADTLQKTLDEEGQSNQMLTGIAEGGFLAAGVNERAEKARKGSE